MKKFKRNIFVELMEGINFMKKSRINNAEMINRVETFEEFMQRLHCAHVDFETLAKWYYVLSYDLNYDEVFSEEE